MPGQIVPDLTAASALTGAELFYAVQGGANRKVTADQIATFIGSAALASRTAFLDAAGDDGTAVVGNPALPFETAQAAVDALLALGTPMSAANPAALFVGVGSFGNVTVAVDLKGLNIYGAGRLASRLGDITAGNAPAAKEIAITVVNNSVAIDNITSAGDANYDAANVTVNGAYVTGNIGASAAAGLAGSPGGNAGNLVLTDCTVVGFVAAQGGDGGDDGMTATDGGDGGSVTLTRCDVAGASSINGGGSGQNGGANGANGTATVKNSVLANSTLFGVTQSARSEVNGIPSANVLMLV